MKTPQHRDDNASHSSRRNEHPQEQVSSNPLTDSARLLRHTVTRSALTPQIVQAMQPHVGNHRLTRMVQRRVLQRGIDGEGLEHPDDYSMGDVFVEGTTYFQVIEVKEDGTERIYWTYVVKEPNGTESEMSFNNLRDMTYLGNKTSEDFAKLGDNPQGVSEMRSGNVFYDWEKGTATNPKEGDVNKDYWENKQSGVEDKHARQFVSAEETKSTNLEGGGTAEVLRGVDYLKSMGGNNFLKRVGGFAFKYTNDNGRDVNLKWLQFLTLSVLKGDTADGQQPEGEPETRVDHNSPAYPYYDPGHQTDKQIMMFDDPEPNRGTFTRLIQDGANYVTEIDTFDTFLVRDSGKEGEEQVLFHAQIKVTFSCDASGKPEDDNGYPIIKTSEIIKQEEAKGMSNVLSKVLSEWHKKKKK